MSKVAEKETVEIAEVVKTEEAKAPTVEDVKAKGWSAKEIESAQKRGMIQNPEEKKEVKVEEKIVEKVEDKKDDLDVLVKSGAELSPEQEGEFLKTRPAGNQDRGLYFRMKNERRGRQAAQEEARKANEKAAAFEARLIALEKGKAEPVLDEAGNEIDPEDKPITLKELRALQQKENEENTKKQEEMRGRAVNVHEAQKAQEEYAKTIYPDFDETANKAKEVIQNLETLIPEKWKQVKIVKLIRDLQTAAANADNIDLDDYTAAHIAHEIGTYHPDYGKTNGQKPVETGTPKSPKVNGGLTPEQMKRVEENTQRRTSSASIPGGGAKITVSVEDVGRPELNAMSYQERQEFKAKHPERYSKLLRG